MCLQARFLPCCINHCDSRKLGLYMEDMEELLLLLAELNSPMQALMVKIDAWHAQPDEMGWFCWKMGLGSYTVLKEGERLRLWRSTGVS